jgi:serine/threonine protein kinase
MAEKLNLGHLGKIDFLSHRHKPVGEAQSYLNGIQSGVRHLHSLGFVHNDITPSNIMFEEDGRPVIIDFDSCRKIGQSLDKMKRTYGWYDPDIKISLESNDLDAVKEIGNWMMGSSAKDFLFERG